MVVVGAGDDGCLLYETPPSPPPPPASPPSTQVDSALRVISIACQSLPCLRAAVPGVCGGAARPGREEGSGEGKGEKICGESAIVSCYESSPLHQPYKALECVCFNLGFCSVDNKFWFNGL